MYQYEVSHKNSRYHANADALSRLPLPESIETTPQPAETVLLMEQIDNGVVMHSRYDSLMD